MRLAQLVDRPKKPKRMKTIDQIANLPKHKVKTIDELSPFPKEIREEDDDESDCES